MFHPNYIIHRICFRANSVTHMKRLFMRSLIWIYTVCKLNCLVLGTLKVRLFTNVPENFKEHTAYTPHVHFICIVTISKKALRSSVPVKYITLLFITQPGHIAQSVAHLTQEPEVPGLIPGPAILSFLLPLIQEGQLPVTGKNMCMKYWLTTLEV